MGIEDRDWYVKRLRDKEGYREQADSRRSDAADPRDATYHPKQFRHDRRTVRQTPQPRQEQPQPLMQMPPDLPGSGWHWSIKALALGWVFALVVMAVRYIRG